MLDQINYGHYAAAFAEVVATALDTTTKPWISGRPLRTDKLTGALRDIYAEGIKLPRGEFKTPEEVIYHLGKIYGNLVTGLQSLNQSFLTFYDNITPMINIETIASTTRAQATMVALAHTQMAARAMSQLQEHVSSTFGKANVFAIRVQQYVNDHRIKLKERASPVAVSIGTQSFRCIQFRGYFTINDNGNVPDLGAWFQANAHQNSCITTAEHQANFAALVREVFGPDAEISNSFSGVTVAVPCIDYAS